MSLLIALVLLFVGQVPPGPPPPEDPYTKIALTEPDVKAAAKVALACGYQETLGGHRLVLGLMWALNSAPSCASIAILEFRSGIPQ